MTDANLLSSSPVHSIIAASGTRSNTACRTSPQQRTPPASMDTSFLSHAPTLAGFIIAASMICLFPRDALSDQFSSGHCSPPIHDLNGNITINCYSEPVDAPLFRVTYYRVGGTAVSLMTQGLLHPRWEAVLGGPQDIVPTPPLDTARDFLTAFSEPFSFGLLQGDDIAPGHPRDREVTIYQQEYSDTMRSLGRDLAALTSYPNPPTYDLTRMFFPDLAAARHIYDPVTWPPTYNVFLASYNYVDYFPRMWRYLTKADLANYEHDYMAFRRAAESSSLFSYPGYGRPPDEITRLIEEHSKVINSLRYLTASSMPEDFLIVEGQDGAHGGWEFTLMLRSPELVVAVIENVSRGPINIGDFVVRELSRNDLRPEDETTDELQTSPQKAVDLFPAEVLNPSEKILVPVRFQFYGQEYDPSKSTLWDLFVNRDTSGKARISGALANKKSRPQIPTEEPRLVPRYAFGAAWTIQALSVNGVQYAVRQYNPNNFVLRAGFEKGSCPILFVWDNENEIWINKGEFLVGANGRARKATEEMEVGTFGGRVRIAEIDGEELFLDQVYVILEGKDGKQEVLRPASSDLREEDDLGVVITGKNWLDIELGEGDESAAEGVAKVVVNGFYRSWYDRDMIGGVAGGEPGPGDRK